MTIRAALNTDAPEITRLVNQLGYVGDVQSVSHRLAKLLSAPEQLILIAELEGQVVGWLQAQASVALESGYRVEIVGLIVDEIFRRRGFARALVLRAEAWAKELGAEYVIVRSNTRRVESHALYPALGYGIAKTQTVYRKVLQADSRIMFPPPSPTFTFKSP